MYNVCAALSRLADTRTSPLPELKTIQERNFLIFPFSNFFPFRLFTALGYFPMIEVDILLFASGIWHSYVVFTMRYFGVIFQH